MHKKPNHILLRLTALGLVFAFFGQEIAQAAPLVVPQSTASASILSDPSRLEIPSEFASLKEVHYASSDAPLLIHIQDAHANISGQENLAKTLDSLMERYDVSLVLSEGGAGDCSLTSFKKIASQETWNKVAKSFLMQGKIAGEEYLNLSSNRPMKILGVEDMSLYMKSVEQYAVLADQREEVLTYLKEMMRASDKLKSKYYPRELIEFERVRSEKGQNFELSFRKLSGIASAKNISLKEFTYLDQLTQLKNKEDGINFNLANLEQAALVEEIKSRGGTEDLEAHLSQIDRLKNERVQQLAYFQNTLNIAKDKGVQIELYTNLLLYVDYLKDFSSLDLERVLGELERAEDKVYTEMLASKDAKLIRSIDRYLKLLVTAYNIQMTTKEFELFKANEPDHATLSYLAFLNRELAEQGYFQDFIAYKDSLEKGQLALEAFYRSVNERDLVFMGNVKAALSTENQKIAVLITGGYHTPHLRSLLRKEGYSYAVVTPVVLSETNQSRYEKNLLAPVRKNIRTLQTGGTQYKKALKGDDLRESLLAADPTGARLAELLKGANPDQAETILRSRTVLRRETSRAPPRSIRDNHQDIQNFLHHARLFINELKPYSNVSDKQKQMWQESRTQEKIFEKLEASLNDLEEKHLQTLFYFLQKVKEEVSATGRNEISAISLPFTTFNEISKKFEDVRFSPSSQHKNFTDMVRGTIYKHLKAALVSSGQNRGTSYNGSAIYLSGVSSQAIRDELPSVIERAYEEILDEKEATFVFRRAADNLLSREERRAKLKEMLLPSMKMIFVAHATLDITNFMPRNFFIGWEADEIKRLRSGEFGAYSEKDLEGLRSKVIGIKTELGEAIRIGAVDESFKNVLDTLEKSLEGFLASPDSNGYHIAHDAYLSFRRAVLIQEVARIRHERNLVARDSEEYRKKDKILSELLDVVMQDELYGKLWARLDVAEMNEKSMSKDLRDLLRPLLEKEGTIAILDDDAARYSIKSVLSSNQKLLAEYFRILSSGLENKLPIANYWTGFLPRFRRHLQGARHFAETLTSRADRVEGQVTPETTRRLTSDFIKLAMISYEALVYAYRDQRIDPLVSYEAAPAYLQANLSGEIQGLTSSIEVLKERISAWQLADVELRDVGEAAIKQLSHLQSVLHPGAMMFRRATGDDIGILIRDNEGNYLQAFLEFAGMNDYFKANPTDKRDTVLSKILIKMDRVVASADFVDKPMDEKKKKLLAERLRATIDEALEEAEREGVRALAPPEATAKITKDGITTRMDLYERTLEDGTVSRYAVHNGLLYEKHGSSWEVMPFFPLSASAPGANRSRKSVMIGGKEYTRVLGKLDIRFTALDRQITRAELLESPELILENFRKLEDANGTMQKEAGFADAVVSLPSSMTSTMRISELGARLSTISSPIEKYHEKFEKERLVNGKTLPVREFSDLYNKHSNILTFRDVETRYGKIDKSFLIVDEALSELSKEGGLSDELIRDLSINEDDFSKKLAVKAQALLNIQKKLKADEDADTENVRILLEEITYYNRLRAWEVMQDETGKIDGASIDTSVTDTNRDKYGEYYETLKILNEAGVAGPILDIGFGTGVMLYFLKFFGIEAEGWGFNEGFKDLAEELGLKVAVQDITQTRPSATPKFAAIFMHNIIEVLDTSGPKTSQFLPAVALSNAFRELASGGIIILNQTESTLVNPESHYSGILEEAVRLKLSIERGEENLRQQKPGFVVLRSVPGARLAERSLSEKWLEGAQEFVTKYPDKNVRGLIAFGSTVEGRAKEGSDFDYILIKQMANSGDGFGPEDLDFMAGLEKHLSAKVHAGDFPIVLGNEQFDFHFEIYFKPDPNNPGRPGVAIADPWKLIVRDPSEYAELLEIIQKKVQKAKDSPVFTGARLAETTIKFDLASIAGAYERGESNVRVDMSTLPDGPLREFVEKVNSKGLGDEVIIVGGAIRDALLGRATADIDIGVLLKLEPEAMEFLEDVQKPDGMSMSTDNALSERADTAFQRLKPKLRQIWSADSMPLFREKDRDLEMTLNGGGTIKIQHAPMNKFIEGHDKLIYTDPKSYFTIDQIGISASGKIYLPKDQNGFVDLRDRKLIIAKNIRGEQNPSLWTVIRGPRHEQFYGMAMTEETARQLKNVDASSISVNSSTKKLFRGLVDDALSRVADRNTLFDRYVELGLFEKLKQFGLTPQDFKGARLAGSFKMPISERPDIQAEIAKAFPLHKLPWLKSALRQERLFEPEDLLRLLSIFDVEPDTPLHLSVLNSDAGSVEILLVSGYETILNLKLTSPTKAQMDSLFSPSGYDDKKQIHSQDGRVNPNFISKEFAELPAYLAELGRLERKGISVNEKTAAYLVFWDQLYDILREKGFEQIYLPFVINEWSIPIFRDILGWEERLYPKKLQFGDLPQYFVGDLSKIGIDRQGARLAEQSDVDKNLQMVGQMIRWAALPSADLELTIFNRAALDSILVTIKAGMDIYSKNSSDAEKKLQSLFYSVEGAERLLGKGFVQIYSRETEYLKIPFPVMVPRNATETNNIIRDLHSSLLDLKASIEQKYKNDFGKNVPKNINRPGKVYAIHLWNLLSRFLEKMEASSLKLSDEDFETYKEQIKLILADLEAYIRTEDWATALRSLHQRNQEINALRNSRNELEAFSAVEEIVYHLNAIALVLIPRDGARLAMSGDLERTAQNLAIFMDKTDGKGALPNNIYRPQFQNDLLSIQQSWRSHGDFNPKGLTAQIYLISLILLDLLDAGLDTNRSKTLFDKLEKLIDRNNEGKSPSESLTVPLAVIEALSPRLEEPIYKRLSLAMSKLPEPYLLDAAALDLFAMGGHIGFIDVASADDIDIQVAASSLKVILDNQKKISSYHRSAVVRFLNGVFKHYTRRQAYQGRLDGEETIFTGSSNKALYELSLKHAETLFKWTLDDLREDKRRGTSVSGFYPAFMLYLRKNIPAQFRPDMLWSNPNDLAEMLKIKQFPSFSKDIGAGAIYYEPSFEGLYLNTLILLLKTILKARETNSQWVRLEKRVFGFERKWFKSPAIRSEVGLLEKEYGSGNSIESLISTQNLRASPFERRDGARLAVTGREALKQIYEMSSSTEAFTSKKNLMRMDEMRKELVDDWGSEDKRDLLFKLATGSMPMDLSFGEVPNFKKHPNLANVDPYISDSNNQALVFLYAVMIDLIDRGELDAESLDQLRVLTAYYNQAIKNRTITQHRGPLSVSSLGLLTLSPFLGHEFYSHMTSSFSRSLSKLTGEHRNYWVRVAALDLFLTGRHFEGGAIDQEDILAILPALETVLTELRSDNSFYERELKIAITSFLIGAHKFFENTGNIGFPIEEWPQVEAKLIKLIADNKDLLQNILQEEKEKFEAGNYPTYDLSVNFTVDFIMDFGKRIPVPLDEFLFNAQEHSQLLARFIQELSIRLKAGEDLMMGASSVTAADFDDTIKAIDRYIETKGVFAQDSGARLADVYVAQNIKDELENMRALLPNDATTRQQFEALVGKLNSFDEAFLFFARRESIYFEPRLERLRKSLAQKHPLVFVQNEIRLISNEIDNMSELFSSAESIDQGKAKLIFISPKKTLEQGKKDRARQKLEEALDLLRKASPTFYERFIQNTKIIVIREPEELKDAAGWVHVATRYVTNLPRSFTGRSVIELASTLIHENAHHEYFIRYPDVRELVEDPKFLTLGDKPFDRLSEANSMLQQVQLMLDIHKYYIGIGANETAAYALKKIDEYMGLVSKLRVLISYKLNMLTSKGMDVYTEINRLFLSVKSQVESAKARSFTSGESSGARLAVAELAFKQPVMARESDPTFKENEYRSFLARHREQWGVLNTSGVLNFLIDRALKNKEIGEKPRLFLLSYGVSTGEEMARNYFELGKALEMRGEKIENWDITITGIDNNAGVLKEAQSRIKGERPFYSGLSRQASEPGDQAYADRVIDYLNKHLTHARQSFALKQDDIYRPRSTAEAIPSADIVFVNHVLRIFNSSSESELIIKRISDVSPQGIIAIGDYARVLPTDRADMDHHLLQTTSNTGKNFNDTLYQFAMPLEFGARLSVDADVDEDAEAEEPDLLKRIQLTVSDSRIEKRLRQLVLKNRIDTAEASGRFHDVIAELRSREDDLDAFIRYLAQFDSPATPFHAELRNAVARKAGMPAEAIVFIGPQNEWIWDLFGGRKTNAGVYWKLTDSNLRVRDLILVWNDRMPSISEPGLIPFEDDLESPEKQAERASLTNDFRILVTLAHEAAHAQQGLRAFELYREEVFRVIIEGYQRTREVEILTALAGAGDATAVKINSLIDRMNEIETVNESRYKGPESFLLKSIFDVDWKKRQPIPSRIGRLLDYEGTYWFERSFVKALTEFAGEEVVRGIYSNGTAADVERLSETLGPYRLLALIELFTFLKDSVASPELARQFERLFYKIATQVVLDRTLEFDENRARMSFGVLYNLFKKEKIFDSYSDHSGMTNLYKRIQSGREEELLGEAVDIIAEKFRENRFWIIGGLSTANEIEELFLTRIEEWALYGNLGGFFGLRDDRPIDQDDRVEGADEAEGDLDENVLDSFFDHLSRDRSDDDSEDDIDDDPGAPGARLAIAEFDLDLADVQGTKIAQALREGKRVRLDLNSLAAFPKSTAYKAISQRFSGIGLALERDFRNSEYPNELNYIVNELLKNAFVHGNRFDRTLPIDMSLTLDERGRVSSIEVFDANSDKPISDEDRHWALEKQLQNFGVAVRTIRNTGRWNYSSVPQEGGKKIVISRIEVGARLADAVSSENSDIEIREGETYYHESLGRVNVLSMELRANAESWVKIKLSDGRIIDTLVVKSKWAVVGSAQHQRLLDNGLAAFAQQQNAMLSLAQDFITVNVLHALKVARPALANKSSRVNIGGQDPLSFEGTIFPSLIKDKNKRVDRKNLDPWSFYRETGIDVIKVAAIRQAGLDYRERWSNMKRLPNNELSDHMLTVFLKEGLKYFLTEDEKVEYDRIAAQYEHSGPVVYSMKDERFKTDTFSQLIYRAKFEPEVIRDLARSLAEDLRDLVRSKGIDYVIAIPTSGKSNSMKTLLDELRTDSELKDKIPDSSVVSWDNAKEAQIAQGDLLQRAANVSGRMKMSPKVKAMFYGKRILVLDNVAASGMTFLEARKELAAQSVIVYTYAMGRTPALGDFKVAADDQIIENQIAYFMGSLRSGDISMKQKIRIMGVLRNAKYVKYLSQDDRWAPIWESIKTALPAPDTVNRNLTNHRDLLHILDKLASLGRRSPGGMPSDIADILNQYKALVSFWALKRPVQSYGSHPDEKIMNVTNLGKRYKIPINNAMMILGQPGAYVKKTLRRKFRYEALNGKTITFHVRMGAADHNYRWTIKNNDLDLFEELFKEPRTGARLAVATRSSIVPVQEKPIDWSKEFGNDNPLSVEIGAGPGNSFSWRIADDKERRTNHIAVELDLPSLQEATRSLIETSEANLQNSRVILGDANQVINMFSAGTVSKYYLIYPSPTPTTPFLTQEFFKTLKTSMKPGGRIVVFTESSRVERAISEGLLNSGLQANTYKLNDDAWTKDKNLLAEFRGSNVMSSDYYDSYKGRTSMIIIEPISVVADKPVLSQTDQPISFSAVYGARLTDTPLESGDVKNIDKDLRVLLMRWLLSRDKAGVSQAIPITVTTEGEEGLEKEFIGIFQFGSLDPNKKTASVVFTFADGSRSSLDLSDLYDEAGKPDVTLDKDIVGLIQAAPEMELVDTAKKAHSLNNRVGNAEVSRLTVAAIPVSDGDIKDMILAHRKMANTKNVHVVFVSPEVYGKDGKLALLQGQTLPEGFQRVVVMANPTAELRQAIQNKENVGLAPMPEITREGDGKLKLGPYTVAFLLAEVLSSFSEEEIATASSNDFIQQMFRLALGPIKYMSLSPNEKVSLAGTLIQFKNDKDNDFYTKITFELLKPFNLTQVLNAAKLVLQAVGAAA